MDNMARTIHHFTISGIIRRSLAFPSSVSVGCGVCLLDLLSYLSFHW
jgi:hypothetical protein